MKSVLDETPEEAAARRKAEIDEILNSPRPSGVNTNRGGFLGSSKKRLPHNDELFRRKPNSKKSDQ